MDAPCTVGLPIAVDVTDRARLPADLDLSVYFRTMGRAALRAGAVPADADLYVRVCARAWPQPPGFIVRRPRLWLWRHDVQFHCQQRDADKRIDVGAAVVVVYRPRAAKRSLSLSVVGRAGLRDVSFGRPWAKLCLCGHV